MRQPRSVFLVSLLSTSHSSSHWTAQRYRAQAAFITKLGDQLGDFISDQASDPAGRVAATAPYRAWFGERWFLLPNPIYGGWENVLSPGGWRDSQDARRAGKWRALDVLTVPGPLPPPQ